VPDLMQMLTNPMVLGGIAAVIVVLLLLMVSRRKRATGGAPRVAEQGSTIPSAAAVTAAAAPVPAPQARAAESAADDIDDAFSSVVEPSRTDKSQAVTDDPLGEADVYLAYGRYEQAESLLRGALNSEPGRADYMLKLLEIYAANKDRPSFERQLEELHEVLEGAPGPQWDRALELARTMAPQHHLVGGGIVAGAAAAEVRAMPDAEAEDLDIDLDFEPVYGDDDADSGEQPLDITQEFDTETLNAAIEAGQAESDRPAAAARDLRFAIDAEEPPAAARTGTHLGFSIDDDDEQTDEAGTADDDLSLSFDLEGDAEPPAGAVDALADLDIDFGSDDLEAEADRRDAGESGETDFDLGEELPDLDLEGEIGSAGGAGADTDMVATKLELAQAYLEMEDYDGARGILEEVVNEGSSAQQQQARELLERCSPS
jgi:pilus assembly protein FimV